MLSDILQEMSDWSYLKTAEDIDITISRKNSEAIVSVVFMYRTSEIPHYVVLGEKYVIVITKTSFLYKNLYIVNGVVGLKSDHLEFLKRQ